jgi:hypothetical protein
MNRLVKAILIGRHRCPSRRRSRSWARHLPGGLSMYQSPIERAKGALLAIAIGVALAAWLVEWAVQ